MTTTTTRLIRPPKSWSDPRTHYKTAMRHPWYRLIVRLNDLVSVRTTLFWSARGAKQLHLPITTGSVSSPMGLGSDSLPVEIELAGVRTHLADSMQFLLEYGCRLSPGGAYYLMPSFRGEPADATHLSQFFHSEAEIQGGLEDVIRVVEEYVRYLTVAILEELPDDIRSVTGSVNHLENLVESNEIEQVEFDDAVRLLDDSPEYVEHNPQGWRSINRRGEQRLMEKAGGFVWLTHMDHLSVPFYQAFADRGRTRSRNADLLLGIGEVVGSGERHAGAEELLLALQMHQVPHADYEWYVEMKRTAPMRTAGFGMGVERFLLWVLDHDDIRDVPLLLRFNGQDIQP